ncbi:MAG TPA: DMT family transporter [Candidatus Thermoplasmatota archaeon]|nr:DMT family transporter [Candidatus Thermoplasmatota archaeon]
MSSAWMLLGLAILCGAAIAVQAGVNATLGRGLASPVHAALVSFAVGTAALALVALARREALPAAGALAAIPWWAWVGGLLGAFFVAVSISLAPRLGAAALLAAILAGQLATALVLDHQGWLGFEERAVTWRRVGGVVLVGAGAALVRFG